jgi:hypothetical protein
MRIGMTILAALCLFIGLFPQAMIKLIGSAAYDLTGGSVLGQLQGGFMIAYYPLTISGNSISPAIFLISLAGVILLTLFAARAIGGKYLERKYGTWDCGFETINARMQYSATGFTKPIKIVFRILYRPMRKRVIKGEHSYHPEAIEYTTSSESIFEKYIYQPLYEKVNLLSRKIKYSVQTGSIRSYLLYIFTAVVLLMIYNRFA